MLVISLDSSQCRNRKKEPDFSSSHFPFPLGGSVGLVKMLVSWWSLKGTHRNGKKWLEEQQSERCRLTGENNFLLLPKRISGCASGTQLSSWGPTGALLWPLCVGFLLKPNCKDRMDQPYLTLHPSQDIARELLRTSVKAGASQYRSASTRKWLNETIWLKTEAMNLQVGNTVHFCIEGMFISVGVNSHLI